MNYKHKVVSNMVYNFLGLVSAYVAGYIFWIILGKFLLPDEYGLVSFFIALYTFVLPFAMVGLKQTIEKIIPTSQLRNKKCNVRDNISFSLKVTTIASTVLGVVAVGSIIMFGSYFGISQNDITLFYIFVPMLVFGSLVQVLHGCLIGLQKFKEFFISNLVGNSFKIIITILLLYLLYGTCGPIIGFLVGFFVSFIFMLYYVYKDIPRKVNIIDKKDIFSYGKFAMTSGMFMFVLLQGPLIYLPLLADMETLAFFRIAVLFGMVVQLPAMILLTGLIPTVSSFWIEKKYNRVASLINMSIKYVLILTIPATIVIMMFSTTILSLVYRVEYLPAVSYINSYLLGSVLWSIFFLASNFLFYIGDPKKLFKLTFIAAAVNILFTMTMIPIYGGVAASDGFLVSQIIASSVAIYYIRKKIGISIKIPLRIFVSSIIFFILIFSVNIYMSTYFQKIIFISISYIIYFITLLKFKVFNMDDVKFLDSIPKYPILDKFKNCVKKSILYEIGDSK